MRNQASKGEWWFYAALGWAIGCAVSIAVVVAAAGVTW